MLSLTNQYKLRQYSQEANQVDWRMTWETFYTCWDRQPGNTFTCEWIKNYTVMCGTSCVHTPRAERNFNSCIHKALMQRKIDGPAAGHTNAVRYVRPCQIEKPQNYDNFEVASLRATTCWRWIKSLWYLFFSLNENETLETVRGVLKDIIMRWWMYSEWIINKILMKASAQCTRSLHSINAYAAYCIHNPSACWRNFLASFLKRKKNTINSASNAVGLFFTLCAESGHIEGENSLFGWAITSCGGYVFIFKFIKKKSTSVEMTMGRLALIEQYIIILMDVLSHLLLFGAWAWAYTDRCV